MFLRVFSILCGTLLGVTSCGVFTPSLPPTAQTQPLADLTATPFQLVPGDEIEVKFPQRPEWNEIVRLRPDGYVDLQYLGSLAAVGLAPDAFAQKIADAYRQLGTTRPQDTHYLLAIGDTLDIRLPLHEGLDQTVKIRPDGRIALPLAGTLIAIGKTPEALAQELTLHYSQSLRHPQVVISVIQYGSLMVQGPLGTSLAGVDQLKPSVQLRLPVPRQIYIGGEVQKPGALNFRQGLSVLQAVVEAGGLKTASAGARTMVMRKTAAGIALIPVDLSTLNSRKVRTTQDIPLQPFDVVVVPKTTLAAAAESVDAIFNLLPPLRNSSFGLIYQIDPKTQITR